MDVQRDWVIRLGAERFGAGPEYLWERTPDAFVLRHPASKKWFAIVMRVSRASLGLEGAGSLEVLNVKTDPLLTGSLLEQEGFLPAYHMNKASWVSVLLDGTFTESQLAQLLEMSFYNVKPKPRKARKRNMAAKGGD